MTRRAPLAALALASAVVLSLAACGSEGSDGAGTTTTATSSTSATDPQGSSGADGPTACAEVGEIPEGTVEGKPTTVDLPAKPTTGDVEVTVLREGDGPTVIASSYVAAHYLGVSCASGEQFDSSWDAGAPIVIAMPSAPPSPDAFSVIPGWNQGLLGQKEGSLVQLDIPSELAYGAQGSPPAIAPNDPLTFIIEVVAVGETPPKV